MQNLHGGNFREFCKDLRAWKFAVNSARYLLVYSDYGKIN